MSKTEILTYVLAVIGSVASFASVASALVPKDSTLGLWLAWFASMPIKHRPVTPAVEPKTVKRITLGSLFVAFLVLPGCGVLKSPTFWDAAEKACVLAMTARPEVVAEAQARKLTGNEWATVICKISDVIEPFVVETDPKAAADHAVLLARPRGLVR